MANFVLATGRLVRDPELRYTQSGIPVCSFTIACDRDFKNANGERETDFINCVVWRQQLAEFVSKYLTKGRLIIVDGRLQLRDWVDRDGNKRRSAEIVANNVHFGDSKPKDQQDQEAPAPGYAAVGASAGGYGAEGLEDGGDLPF